MDYIFVHRIDADEPVTNRIPLHMTMFHWFTTSVAPETIVKAARAALRDISPLITTVTQEDLFGPDKDIPVVRLERTPELLELHLALLQVAKSLGGTLDERWVGAKRWNPHVTHTENSRLTVGDSVHIDSIDLIARTSHDSPRTLVASFPLNS